jgi:hypothetical protein
MDPSAARPSSGATGADPVPCAGCGAPAPGPFCSQCGEELATHREASTGGALARWRDRGHRAAPAFVRTFVTLVAHPGLLTREYVCGRRRRYLRPLQVFLMCNALFFFVQPH